jgi:predicted DNA-binding antitoxin AbrB/MazE fold protein
VAKSVEAVYERGALWPLEPLVGIREHSRVRLHIEPQSAQPHPLANVIGTLSDADADEMLRLIEEEFESVDAREWK